jgi:hypothetical protein
MLAADGRLLVDDVVQGLARHPQDLSRTLSCQVQRFETFVLDDATGGAGSSWAYLCFRSLVIIDQRHVVRVAVFKAIDEGPVGAHGHGIKAF